MFIKFSFRRNLIYPLQYIIWSLLRELLIMVNYLVINFESHEIFLSLMFLGELLGGAIMYCYERKIMKKKTEEKQEKYFMSIKLIEYDKEVGDFFVPLDGKIKIIFLMFLSAFNDFVQFSITTIEIYKLKMLSYSINHRLSGISTISAFLFHVYALKLPVFKHHKISLLIIGICLIVVIIMEFIFETMKTFVTFIYVLKAVVYIIFSQVLTSCKDSIEKYLFEFDYMNPFVVLMYEGLFGFLLSFLLFINKNYFKDIEKFIEKKRGETDRKKHIIALPFLFLSYIILRGGKNLFRIVTNKIYSPMTKSFIDYVLNPFYIIYYFSIYNDFYIKANLNYSFLLINIIISLIISFFGCVYNEFIILFCCGLERNTHDQISQRAKSFDELSELVKFDNGSDDDEENNY